LSWEPSPGGHVIAQSERNGAMTSNPNTPKTTRSKPKKRKEPQAGADADRSDNADRDLVHGEGGTVGLGKPGELNQDD
jgi:hypothetical protein